MFAFVTRLAAHVRTRPASAIGPAGLATLTLLLLVPLIGPAWAQGGWSVISRRDARDLLKQSERMRPGATTTAMTVPLEAAIDPETYTLSPGDVLSLTIWGAAELFLDLTVTSDGKLMIPSVGVLAVDGLTLQNAADSVRARCAAPYPRSEATLALVRPAVLRIPVTGLVQVPGIHQVVSSSRLSDLLLAAGGLLASADRRNILLRHADRREKRCDLLAWELEQEGDGNPVLRSGDHVHVLPAGEAYRVRGMPHRGSPVVSGAAGPLEPETALIPFHQGDTLEFALRAAGGLGPFFCGDLVWVRRGEDEPLEVPLSDAPDFQMRPKDIVEIPFCREWVSVGGSVVRPGIYPYLPGQTVADYIYLAGGPSARGRHSGWQLLDPSGERHGAAPADTLAAGSQIWVHERRAHTYATLLTPIASAVALLVSVVALTR